MQCRGPGPAARFAPPRPAARRAASRLPASWANRCRPTVRLSPSCSSRQDPTICLTCSTKGCRSGLLKSDAARWPTAGSDLASSSALHAAFTLSPQMQQHNQCHTHSVNHSLESLGARAALQGLQGVRHRQGRRAEDDGLQQGQRAGLARRHRLKRRPGDAPRPPVGARHRREAAQGARMRSQGTVFRSQRARQWSAAAAIPEPSRLPQ